MPNLLRTSLLAMLLAGSLAQPPALAQSQSSDPLSSYLQDFQQIFYNSLNDLLSWVMDPDTASPITQTILGGIEDTLGALGLPIPSELRNLANSTAEDMPQSIFQPPGDNQQQIDYVIANTVSNHLSNGVLGESGQQNLNQLLNDSQNAWQDAFTTIDQDATNNVSDVQDLSSDIQSATSTLEAIQGMAEQNAALADLQRNLGTSNVSLGEIGAMQLNIDAQQLTLSAGQLQSQQQAANAITGIAAANNAQVAGAGGFVTSNALQMACLSTLDCQ